MKRWLCVFLPIVVLATGITWRVVQKKAEVGAQTQQRAARMNAPAVATVTTVQVRDLTRTFEATGSAEAPLSVKIAPKITGRIEYLQVHEGDRVKRGQVLVRIDDSAVEAEVQQQAAALAEAKYRLAQARLTQGPTDVGVGAQVRQQKAAVASADADLSQARETQTANVEEAKANVQDAESKVENAAASVKSAEANLVNAQRKYERKSSLLDKGYLAAQDVDDAKASLAVYQAGVDVAEGQLRSAQALKRAAEQRLAVAEAKGRADVEAARAKLDQAHASFDYAQANTAQKSAFRQSIAALQAGVAAAQAGLESSRSKRADTVLISPLEGYVTGRYSDPGAIASPTQPILSVQFIKDIWVMASVPEEVCAKLHIGQTVTVRFDAVPGREFSAGVVQINPSADAQSRQFTVRAVLSNKENLLKPGMFARVLFETDRIRNAVVVPREAVSRDRMGTSVVLVDRQQKAKRVPVVVGDEDDRSVAILSGVKAGDRVVAISSFPVKDGQMVVPGGGKGGRPSTGSGRGDGSSERVNGGSGRGNEGSVGADKGSGRADKGSGGADKGSGGADKGSGGADGARSGRAGARAR